MSSEHEPPAALAQPWVMILGAIFGALTLLFFMGLVLLGVAGHEVPCNTVFLVNITLSLGAALAVGFLGGNASAKGAIPFLQNSLAVSLTGGFAALIITLLVTFSLFGKNDCATSDSGTRNTTMTASPSDKLVIWEKNQDAMRSAGSWLGSSAANECGYRSWTHREALVATLNALTLSEAPELSVLRDRLLAAVNDMPPKCGSDEWYNLAMSPAMEDLRTELVTGLRAKVIENGGHVSDR
jgi:hypothetical protein